MTDASDKQIKPKSVLELIYDWSTKQSLWKRDALRRIIQSTVITDDDISDLVGILEREHSDSKEDVGALVLEKSSLPNRPKGGDDVKIVSISDVNNVNCLAAGQTLNLGQTAMTVVFGNNGSGKSGYTRILKSACTARHRPDILPNIYGQGASLSEPPSATIKYQVGDSAPHSVDWGNSEYPHEVLSAINVFDRECSEIHIGSENEVSVPFRPLGLDIPEKLVGVYKRVENALKQKNDALGNSQNAIFYKPIWKETTPVGKLIANLSENSDVHKVYENITFSEEDAARLRTLKERLATELSKQIADLQNKLTSIVRLENHIGNLETQYYSDEKWNELKQCLSQLDTTQNAANIAAGKDSLKNVAFSEWKVLWEAARQFSTTRIYPKKAFPNTDDEAACVLCQQPLDDEAKIRMASFEEYVKSETEQKLREAKAKHTTICTNIRSTTVYLTDIRGELESLKLHSEQCYLKVIKHLAAIRCRRSLFLRMVTKQDTNISIIDLSGACQHQIELTKLSIEKSIKELQEASTKEGRSTLIAEKDSLSDKQWADQNFEVIRKEIDRLKSLHFVQECLKGTKSNAVTHLSNDLADEVITPQLRDNFLKEITDLVENKFRVEIVRSSGRAGASKYKVQLVRSPKKAVPKILSEGEQTCVGIASFFAELATSEHNSALVFDDPISSLDHRWRTRVAERLAEEARHRQVVVFTHDLIFLNDLEDAAKRQEILFTSKHLKSTPEQSGLVDDNLPWEGMGILARIDAMGKDARDIQRVRKTIDDDDYKKRAREFYSNLRASWERALEEVALSHIVMRHRDYINSKNVRNLAALNQEICNEWSQNFGRCCDFTESHDTSRGRAQELPEPAKLIEDVNKLGEWVKTLKAAHKEIERLRKTTI